ncbi:unnamed protein product [Caenorhabditis bovis]|uniref:Uncharacterized protein n=1 Tax=Caenorhabditis bovis TaxID=2654633 RepID=A0A8S1FGG1_9PELO|nr:unnamed protein product [Caenorhabditis bovis]
METSSDVCFDEPTAFQLMVSINQRCRELSQLCKCDMTQPSLNKISEENKKAAIMFDFDINSKQFLKHFEETQYSNNSGSFTDPIDTNDELRRLKQIFNNPFGSESQTSENLPILLWPIPKNRKLVYDNLKDSPGAFGRCVKSLSNEFTELIEPPITIQPACLPSLSLERANENMKISHGYLPSSQQNLLPANRLQYFKDPVDVNEELARLKALFGRPFLVKSVATQDDCLMQSEKSNLETSDRSPTGQRKRNANGQFLNN